MLPLPAVRAHTPKGGDTRLRIFACAREVLVREGFDALAMRDLARRCNLQLGNLQYYYPTRDAVAAAIIEAEAAADVEVMRKLRAEHSDAELAARQLVHTLVRRWRSDSGYVFATLTYLALHKAEFRALRARVYAAFYAELGEFVRALDPRSTAAVRASRVRLIGTLVDGAAQQLRVGDSERFLGTVANAVVAIARGDEAPVPIARALGARSTRRRGVRRQSNV